VRIPKQVRICGNVWRVKLAEHLVSGKGEELSGLMSPKQRVIYLDKHLDAKEMFATFLHEFNHAVLKEVGFHTAGLESGLEELIVENLAQQYVSCFRIVPKPHRKS
jgi:uncharacterized protein YjaZ